MSSLEQTPPHSEDIIEKRFILPRLKEQKEALEKEYNSVKARENDPIVNRCRFRVITNEKL